MRKNIITPEELYDIIQDEPIVVVDTRFSLSDTSKGKNDYIAGHIPGAVYFDLDKDLSSPLSKHGGRHPLPDFKELAAKLGQAGIDRSKHVIVYDDANGMIAGRLWWLLRYMGHSNVRILDGGFQAWQTNEYPVTEKVVSKHPVVFTPDFQTEMLVSIDELKEKLHSREAVIIDSRGSTRYTGEVEPIDKKAGHIPGAVSRPFEYNLQNGSFKSVPELKARFIDLEATPEIIVYCGSGVSAVHNIIAMEEAGIDDVRLYAGSWSDWISYEDNPITTGLEP